MGRITLSRLGKFDLMRGYNILLDGKSVGKLRYKGRIALDCPPGAHVIEARIDWCWAKPLSLMVPDVGDVKVEVINTRGWKGAAAGADIFDPGNYLTLRIARDLDAPVGPWG
jgi:hypothetical protein